MAFAFIENQAITRYPVGLFDIRRKYPNVSFPSNTEGVNWDDFGVVIVNSTPRPSIDYRTQKVEETTPSFDGEQWNQTWEVSTLSAEEQELILENQKAVVRSERNGRLASCDWTQLPDAPVNAAEWATYRQDLRDISDQPGFPWEVAWPEEP